MALREGYFPGGCWQLARGSASLHFSCRVCGAFLPLGGTTRTKTPRNAPDARRCFPESSKTRIGGVSATSRGGSGRRNKKNWKRSWELVPIPISGREPLSVHKNRSRI